MNLLSKIENEISKFNTHQHRGFIKICAADEDRATKIKYDLDNGNTTMERKAYKKPYNGWKCYQSSYFRSSKKMSKPNVRYTME